MVERNAWRQGPAAIALCAAAGMADAIGYVNSGIFAANMTGNTVLVALALGSGKWMLASQQALCLAMFLIGAMLGRVLLLVGKGRVSVPFLIETALIVACAVMEGRGFAATSLIAIAMGVQSTAMARFQGVAVSTVVVTSSIARLAEAAVDRCLGSLRHHVTPSVGTGLYAGGWLAYGVGALIAGLLARVTDLSLVLPAAIVLGVTALLAQRS